MDIIVIAPRWIIEISISCISHEIARNETNSGLFCWVKVAFFAFLERMLIAFSIVIVSWEFGDGIRINMALKFVTGGN